MNHKELDQIRQLVLDGNRKRINVLLGSYSKNESNSSHQKQNTSLLDFCLIPTPPKAGRLLDLFISSISKNVFVDEVILEERNNTDGLTDCCLPVDVALRALLMVEPNYVTPWQTFFEFAKVCNRIPDKSLLKFVSSIEDFLLNTQQLFLCEKILHEDITSSRLRHYQQLTCQEQSEKGSISSKIASSDGKFGYWILRIAKTLSTQLLSNNEKGRRDKKGGKQTGKRKRAVLDVEECEKPSRIISELWYTFLLVVKIVDKNHVLFESIVSSVYLQNRQADKICVWLQLVLDSQLLLSKSHLQKIGGILLRQLSDDRWKISEGRHELLPLIAKCIKIVNGLSSIEDIEVTSQIVLNWVNAAVLLFSQAVTDESQYESALNCLRKHISIDANSLLRQWLSRSQDLFGVYDVKSSIPDCIGKIPLWSAWTIFLVLFEISTYEERIRLRVSTTCSDDRFRGPISDECVERERTMCKDSHFIIQSAFGKSHDFRPFLENADEIRYVGHGVFCSKNNSNEDGTMSRCGRLIMQCIFLGHREPAGEEDGAFDRFIRFLNMLDSLAIHSSDEEWASHSALTILVCAVGYFELSYHRQSIIHRIRAAIDTLAGCQNGIFKCYTSVVGFIMSLTTGCCNNDECLEPIFLLLDEKGCSFYASHYRAFFFSIPKARSLIFLHHKKNLETLCVKFRNANGNALDGSIDEEIRDGLHYLLDLCCFLQWKEIESDAWRIFSDIFVLNVPVLYFSFRSWLYKQLNDVVRNDEIRQNPFLKHLHRAAVVRLSLLVNGLLNEHDRNLRSSYVEEIICLHRLIVLLFRSVGTSDDETEDRRLLLARGREAFLRSILSQKMGKASPYQPIIQFVNTISADHLSEVDGFSLCWALFLELNTIMLNFFLCDGCTHANSFSDSRDKDCHLLRRVQFIEMRELQSPFANSAKVYPKWCAVTGRIDIREETAMNESSALHRRQDSLLGVLLELLFLVPIPALGSRIGEDALSWKIILAAGHLISQKKRRNCDGAVDNVTDSFSLNVTTVDETAESFLSASSLLIRDAVDRNCNAEVLEELLHPILLYCDSLSCTLLDSNFPVCSRVVENLWGLYQAIVSEKASLKMIEYLESQSCNEQQQVAKRKDKQVSITDLNSENDVDNAIQKIRLKCLLPLEKALSRLEEFSMDPPISQSLLAGILEAFVTDLRAGLDGRSGGITSPLYRSYCRSIRSCCTLLFNQMLPCSFDSSVFELFEKITEKLTCVLIDFPLYDSDLFKATFIVALAELPSMCQNLLQSKLLSTDSADLMIRPILMPHNNIIKQTFDDCIEILTRWTTLREPLTIPWGDIAGSEHIDRDTIMVEETLYSRESTSHSLEGLERDEIPRVVHIPSQGRCIYSSKTDLKQCHRRIRLHSKEVWSWALSSLLAFIEQNWGHSELTILAKADVSFGPRLSANVSALFQAKKTELQVGLTYINKFFNPPIDPMENAILDILAMNMPSAPRSRLLKAIKRIAQALTHSLRTIGSFLFYEKTDDSPSMVLHLVESMCCLSAWLSHNGGYGNSNRDFTSGVFNWLEIASKKRRMDDSTAYNIQRKVETQSLLSELVEVSEDIYNLYASLKKLKRQIQCIRSDNPLRAVSIDRLSSIFFDYNYGNDGLPEDEMENDTFLNRISAKILLLAHAIPEEVHKRSLPAFSMEECADNSPLEGNPSRRKNKKRTHSSYPVIEEPLSKRTMHESRNKIVNMFMQLDQGIEKIPKGRGETGEDLEDFIVDG